MKKLCKTMVIALFMTLISLCFAGCAKTVTVTFAQADGKVVATAVADKTGKVYEPALKPAAGYEIAGWYLEKGCSGDTVDLKTEVFKQNATLYAKVVAIDYAVTYDLAYPGAQNVPPNAIFNLDGSFVTAPVPVRVGYEFLGWTDGSGNIRQAGETITAETAEDVKLVATWKTKMLTVTFYDDVQRIGDSQEVPYNGNAVSPVAAPHTYSWCYEFKEWDNKLTEITEDTEIHAVYQYVPTALSNGEEYEFTEIVEGGVVVGYSLKIPGIDYGYYYDSEFEVPDSLALPNQYNGKPVIALAKYALREQSTLKELFIPEGVKTLDENALYLLEELKSVYIPASLTEIKHLALYELGYETDKKMPEFDCAAGGNFIFDGTSFKSADGKKIIYTDKFVTEFHADVDVEELYPYLFALENDFSPLQSVVIDGDLKKLYGGTFLNCSYLSSVTFNGTLEEIEGYEGEYTDKFGKIQFQTNTPQAFGGCHDLSSVNLPYGLKKLGDGAFFDTYFYNRFGWNEIILPDTLEYIGWDAYTNMEGGVGITSIKMVDAKGKTVTSNDYYLVRDNCLIAKNVEIVTAEGQTIKGDSLYLYASGSNATNYTVPDSVKEIKEFAFAYLRHLESLTLPEGLTEIKAGSILGDFTPEEDLQTTSSLLTLNIPDSVEIIRSYSACVGSYSVDGYGGLRGLCKLTELTISSNSSLATIESQAMRDIGLQSLYLPATVASIGKLLAITGQNLREINVDPANEHYCSDDGVLFDKDIKTLILYPPGNTRTEYTVPSGITELTERCMLNNRFLESITLPASLTLLKGGVFFNSKSLQTIIFEGSVAPELTPGENAYYRTFDGFTSDNKIKTLNVTVTVPTGAYYSYLRSFMKYLRAYEDLISKDGQSLTTFVFNTGTSGQVLEGAFNYVEKFPIPDSYDDGGRTMYFTGWFTKNGADGDWGEEASGEFYINESGGIITLYARFELTERRNGTEPFPWTANDTEWSLFKIKGEPGETVWVKIPAKTKQAVMYINGIRIFYIFNIRDSSLGYSVKCFEIESHVISALEEVESNFEDLRIKLIYYATSADVWNSPKIIPFH